MSAKDLILSQYKLIKENIAKKRRIKEEDLITRVLNENTICFRIHDDSYAWALAEILKEHTTLMISSSHFTRKPVCSLVPSSRFGSALTEEEFERLGKEVDNLKDQIKTLILLKTTNSSELLVKMIEKFGSEVAYIVYD